LLHFLLQPVDALLRGQILSALGENSTPGTLGISASPVKCFDAVITFDQLVLVVLDVFDDSLELRASQARHSLVEKFEVVAAA